MLGELTGEDEADRGLDLARRDGRLLVVSSELASLGCDTLEDVWKLESENETRNGKTNPNMDPKRQKRLTVDEGVEDGHGTVGDTGVGVDLLEDYERRVSKRDQRDLLMRKAPIR